MYGLAEYEVGRQHREEIRYEVAANRLESKLRAHRGGQSRLVRDLGNGIASFSFATKKKVARGQTITATGAANTSEFSAARKVVVR